MAGWVEWLTGWLVRLTGGSDGMKVKVLGKNTNKVDKLHIHECIRTNDID